MARIRNPASSRWARIRPVRLRPVASGLMMASVCSMASLCASEEFADDVPPVDHPGYGAGVDHGDLLDVFVDHHAGHLTDSELLGDAENGPGHDVPHGAIPVSYTHLTLPTI